MQHPLSFCVEEDGQIRFGVVMAMLYDGKVMAQAAPFFKDWVLSSADEETSVGKTAHWCDFVSGNSRVLCGPDTPETRALFRDLGVLGTVETAFEGHAIVLLRLSDDVLTSTRYWGV